MNLLPLIPLILQVGPAPTLSEPSQLPPELRDRRAMERAAPAEQAAAPTGRHAQCLAEIEDDPEAAQDRASLWLAQSTPGDRALAGHCLGMAYAAQGVWSDARAAFASARENAAMDQLAFRARLAALAGNAAVLANRPDLSIAHFNAALADALAGGEGELAGEIGLDRAMALAASGREEEAMAALAEARDILPQSSAGWLLSATLARRLDRLADAQKFIERAADLDPRNPEIGLEAGLIAVLAGNEAAARRSWESVVAAAPQSAAARSAATYLEQLRR